MQIIKRGDSGPAAAEIYATLVGLGLLTSGPHTPVENPEQIVLDAACELAIRQFQQSRGLVADGLIGPETWRALLAARYRLGDRVLNYSVKKPLVGDDIHALQERLLEMGYDVGRVDGIFGLRTDKAVRSFQRECGLISDGVVGPATMRALRRLARKVVGGRPQLLREFAMLDVSGPRLHGKRLVIDPGHGGADPGIVVPTESDSWSEAEVCYDLALRLQGRFAAIGGQAYLTRGPESGPNNIDRAEFANNIGADVFLSLHLDRHANAAAGGIATYHFGTGSGASSTVGERLAGLVQREIVARTGLVDCRTHAQTWDILRLTRMPAVQVEFGYLTSPQDRAQLTRPEFRDTVAEALLAAVQRIFLPIDADVHTGTLDLSALQALQLR